LHEQSEQTMQQPKTIQTNLTKKYLLTVMRKQLAARTFNREQFKKQYGLDTPKGDRNTRRYLNQIAEEIGPVQADNLVFLKNYCVDNLITKAVNGELDESTEAKIALSGDTAKVDINLNQHVSVKKQIEALIKISSEPECNSSNE
jgi:hypothetical protein